MSYLRLSRFPGLAYSTLRAHLADSPARSTSDVLLPQVDFVESFARAVKVDLSFLVPADDTANSTPRPFGQYDDPRIKNLRQRVANNAILSRIKNGLGLRALEQRMGGADNQLNLSAIELARENTSLGRLTWVAAAQDSNVSEFFEPIPTLASEDPRNAEPEVIIAKILVGQRVSQLLQELGWSGARFAKEAGTSSSTLTRITGLGIRKPHTGPGSSGEAYPDPSLETLVSIANASGGKLPFVRLIAS